MWFLIGVVVGFVFACLCIAQLKIGILKFAFDGDETYMFVELDDNGVSTISKRSLVLLEVDNSPVYSHE